MNHPNPSTAEAHEFLADTTPSAARCFGTVVQPHLTDALALARRLTRNRADSEDVVQEACLRALLGLGNFADGDPRSWVLTIVRHTAYDWLKRNRPKAVVSTDNMDDLDPKQLPEHDAGTSESWLIDREYETLLKDAIAVLPAQYRQTLALRHVQGLTYREIAEYSGISIGTVMSRLSRARRHLAGRSKRRRSGNNSNQMQVSHTGRQRRSEERGS
jgi:RNA polymerase sigma factor (sigma-70 family)